MTFKIQLFLPLIIILYSFVQRNASFVCIKSLCYRSAITSHDVITAVTAVGTMCTGHSALNWRKRKSTEENKEQAHLKLSSRIRTRSWPKSLAMYDPARTSLDPCLEQISAETSSHAFDLDSKVSDTDLYARGNSSSPIVVVQKSNLFESEPRNESTISVLENQNHFQSNGSTAIRGNGLESHPFSHEMYIQHFNTLDNDPLSEAANSAPTEQHAGINSIAHIPLLTTEQPNQKNDTLVVAECALYGQLASAHGSPGAISETPSDGQPPPGAGPALLPVDLATPSEPARPRFSQDAFMSQLSRPESLQPAAAGTTWTADADQAEAADKTGGPFPGAAFGFDSAGRPIFSQDFFMSQLSRGGGGGTKYPPEGGGGVDSEAAAAAGRRAFSQDAYLSLLGRGTWGDVGGRDQSTSADYLSSLQRYTDDGIRLSGVSRYSEEVPRLLLPRAPVVAHSSRSRITRVEALFLGNHERRCQHRPEAKTSPFQSEEVRMSVACVAEALQRSKWSCAKRTPMLAWVATMPW